MLAMPMHPEQALVSRRVDRAGIGVRVASKADAAQIGLDLQRVLTDPAIRQRVREIAQRHAGLTPQVAGRRVVEAVESVLARA
jgi:UDP:flavonoid glycosyltransferase YjiC (YdhE family)